jgi:hypothetical protein
LEKPKWLKSKVKTEAKKEAVAVVEKETNEAEVKYVFEVVELYKSDDNTEEFFKPQYK